MSGGQNTRHSELVISEKHELVTSSAGLTKRALRLAATVYSRPEVEKAFAGETKRAIQIALERPRRWEYLLTAELLASRIAGRRTILKNSRAGGFSDTPIGVSGAELMRWIGTVNKDFMLHAQQWSTFGSELMASWGPPGDSGDPLKIKDVVDKGISWCDKVIHYLIELQSKIPPDPYRKLKELTITWVVDVADEYLAELERMVIELETPSEGARAIRLLLKFSPNSSNACADEMARLHQLVLVRQIDPFIKLKGL
jgi:hypothetical protein